MDGWVQCVVTVVCAVLASSGFWAVVTKTMDKKSSSSKLLLGLAHDRIIFLCEKYITRGYITVDEYENLNDYLFVPYTERGGNGTAAKMMQEVNKLRMVKSVDEIK